MLFETRKPIGYIDVDSAIGACLPVLTDTNSSDSTNIYKQTIERDLSRD